MASDNIINGKTSYELPFQLLCGWLKMLSDKTNNRDIEHALRNVQFVPLTDPEREIIVTIRQIYISEMNGDLTPPPSMREVYTNIEQYYKEPS